MFNKTVITALFAVTSTFLVGHSWADEKTYTFGVVPQQSATRLAALWNPVLTYVGEKAGVNLQFKTAKDIPEFENRLAAGDYDLAYMNPYHFTVFNHDPGYTAMAVRKDQPIKGIMVVQKDSDITTMAQLTDQRLAFPAPAAFAASVLPRAQLSNDGIPFTSQYVSSHDSVYLAVSKGIFPAGGGVLRTLNNTPPEVREQLKVMWTSPGFTPHAIAAHPSLEQADYLRIQEAFVGLVDTPEGKELLESLKLKNGLIRANDSDWDDVRGLGIDLLNQLINQ